MQGNSINLFTNSLLLARFQQVNKENNLQKPLGQLTDQQMQDFIQKQLQKGQVNPTQIEQFTKTINSLDYSVDTNNLRDQQTPNQSNVDHGQLSFEIQQNANNTNLLSELLANDDVETKKDNNMNTFATLNDKQNIEQNVKQYEREEEQMVEYSMELSCLKDKIVQIQSLAQQQIIRLKKQLEKERQLRLNQKQPTKLSAVDVGINTQEDFRDQQIQVLRESLLHHITLNKELLSNELNKQNKSINSHISKVTL